MTRSAIILSVCVAAAACNPSSDLGSVSKTIGPAGGELSMPDGLTLLVPPDALHEETTMEITKLKETLEGHTSSSHVYAFEPAGLVFDIPATLDIPFPNEGDPLENIRIWVEDDDKYGAIASTGGGTITSEDGSNGQFVRGAVNHFSRYAAGAPAWPASFCFQPIVPGGLCELTGGQNPGISWGITQWGGAGHRLADGTCRYPNTTVEFTVHAPDILILESWEVEPFTNVASIHVGVEDLTAIPKAFVPHSPGYDWRAAGSALPAPLTDPFWGWWSFSVWPEDSLMGMHYRFRLKLAHAQNNTFSEIIGEYDSTGLKTECDCGEGWPETCDGPPDPTDPVDPTDPGEIPLTEGYWGYSIADAIDAFYVDIRFLADGTAKIYTRRYNPNFDHGCPSSPDGGVYNDGVSLETWTQSGDVITVGSLEYTRNGEELLQTSPAQVLQRFDEPQTPGPCSQGTGAPTWP